ncbi:MAG TPA: PaaI family thioesterase, partial [Candidatus Acidoferrum sp.]|nr:PaaI family thioesterase [Candidatus Acidoferrum sp.]
MDQESVELKAETRPDGAPPNACFGCGDANAAGMHLPFERDAATQRVRGSFRLDARYQGAPGMIHGGIIAVVLDEALGKVCRFADVRAVTAELTIEYLRPIQVDQEIHVEAFQVERKERNLF